MIGRTMRVGWYSAVVVIASAASLAVVNAIELTITPATVSSDYSGSITMDVAGIASGKTVLVEATLDANGNGVTDPGEMLIQTFRVTDGQASFIGGVRNINVPGDEDGTVNGRIRTTLNFQALSGAAVFASKLLYRVSDGSGASAGTPFSVTQPPYAQGVTGQVMSGCEPVPGAFVVLLSFAEREVLTGTLADDNGYFTLNTAPGTYLLVAVKSGFVFDRSTSSAVTVSAGATTTQQLSLTPANRTISGRLADAQTGESIPGVPLLAQSSTGLITLGSTDADGNFRILVSEATATWNLRIPDSVTTLGYVNVEDGYLVDTSAGDVSDITIEWQRGDALVYGTLKDEHNSAVTGMIVETSVNGGQYFSEDFTNSDGMYVAAIVGGPGAWHVDLRDSDVLIRGYVRQHTDVVVAAGQAVQVDLVLRHFTAYLRGQLLDNFNAPIGGGRVNAANYQREHEAISSGYADPSGHFEVGVYGGDWVLYLSNAAQQGLTSPELHLTVADGVDQNGIVYRSQRSCPSGLQVATDALPNGTQGSFYSAQLQAVCGPPPYAWSLAPGSADLPAGLNLSADGNISGTPTAVGTFAFVANVAAGASATADRAFTMIVNDQRCAASCVGDCDGGGDVTVNELITIVNIALGNAQPSACPHGVSSGAEVGIAVIIRAVNNALNECPA